MPRATVLFPIAKSGNGVKFVSNEPVPAVILSENSHRMELLFPFDAAVIPVHARMVRKSAWTERVPLGRNHSEYADVLAQASDLLARTK